MKKNFWAEWAIAVFRAWNYPLLYLWEGEAVSDPTFNLAPPTPKWECQCCGHKMLGGECHCEESK